MSTISDAFFGKYSSTIQQNLDHMEQIRKKSVPRFFFWFVVLSVAVVSFFSLFTGVDTIALLVNICCEVPVLFFVVRKYFMTDITKIYKEDVMPALVNAIGEAERVSDNDCFQYLETVDVTPEQFIRTNLFEINQDESAVAEDGIKGVIDKTDFLFCEATYTYEDQSSDDNKESTVTKFRGLLFDADFNKNFQGGTILTQQYNHVPEGYKAVKLENQEFSNLFKVYSTDGVECRYILSPALQERIVNMMHNIKQSVGTTNAMISFYDSRVALLIPSSVDHFEANLFSKLKMDRVKSDFTILEDMISIVKELKLNTRIWTKQ